MTAALYARISTHEGKQFSENQLREVRRFAKAHGWKVYREYIDEASGAQSDRDALAELMADAHARRFDHVVVFALDRLTREGVFKAFGYLEALKLAGVTFWSATEPQFGTAGAFGEIMVAIAAWIAQQERTRLRERIKAGLERAKASGTILGRRKAVFDLLKAREMRESGKSIRQTAKALGVSASVIARGMCGA